MQIFGWRFFAKRSLLLPHSPRRLRQADWEVIHGVEILDQLPDFFPGAKRNWHEKVEVSTLKTRVPAKSILSHVFPNLTRDQALHLLRPLVGGGSGLGFFSLNLQNDPRNAAPTPEELDLVWTAVVMKRLDDNVVPFHRAA